MYFEFNQLNEYLDQFDINSYKLVSKKKTKYYNIPCAFDIESTSAYIDNEMKIHRAKDIAILKENLGYKFDETKYKKLAWMYIWMLSIDDNIIIGRTWEEYILTQKAIVKKFELGEKKKLIYYVHNLAFEFQFLKDRFNWEKIFASESHKVIYACDSLGFMYKCSYFLSNSSLATVGKNLTKYKAEKKTGDLDYDSIRHSKTLLTKKEIDYCLYDVIVLSNYIKECIEKEKSGKITEIPLTSTGYVRRYCKEHCLTNNINKNSYYKITRQFDLDTVTYNMLIKAFQGGFTHTNSINMGEVFKNVKSMDFTSSYPAVLLLRKYPMGKGHYYKPKSIKDFEFQIKKFCCLFEITFYNIRLKDGVTETILSGSEHKCKTLNAVLNNGRIDSAEKLKTTITEADYSSIKRFYDWDKIGIGTFKRYPKGFLPKELLECILEFYNGKTTLKDVKGKEVEYQQLKSLLNAIFGMMVTNPVRDEILYSQEIDKWSSSHPVLTESLELYNKSRNRFIAYEWGVWCTAYARQNLFSGILELGNDFIYGDTDSLKFVNFESHKDYFINYNKYIDRLVKRVCEYYNFDENLFRPKTIKGKVKPIGYWDKDGEYAEFKALGAKRYLVKYNEPTNDIKNTYHILKEKKELNDTEEDELKKIINQYEDYFAHEDTNGYSITVSGINKKVALPNLIKKAHKLNEDIFNIFDDDMYVDCESSGKLIHSYLNEHIDLIVEDYQGIKYEVKELSSVHLEPTSYSLSITEDYLRYVKGIKLKYNKAIE